MVIAIRSSFQMMWTIRSTCQMTYTLRSDVPLLSDKVHNWDQNQKWVHIFRWSVQIQIYPPFSVEVYNWEQNHKWVHIFNLMSMCTASCSLHLTTMGGISDSLSGHFIWKYELISDVHLHFILFTSSDNYWRGISDNLSEHFIWKYELISSFWGLDLSVHFIWGTSCENGGYIWIWTLHLKIWVSVCTSSETGGVYLNLNTSSESLSSQTFKCGHHRGLFTLHKTSDAPYLQYQLARALHALAQAKCQVTYLRTEIGYSHQIIWTMAKKTRLKI